jgi:adenylate cyclase
MNFEIERKFLVRNDDWRKLAISQSVIRQVYLDSNPKVSIRVRIKDNSVTTLSLKSRPSSLRRMELEYTIPIIEAEALIPLRQSFIIEKARYIVSCGDLAWEIDVFSGENIGLIIAEIELPDEYHNIELPAWIGPEVTGQTQYYNGTLAQRPFRLWPQRDSAASAPENRRF